jgi:deoxyribonuclease-4
LSEHLIGAHMPTGKGLGDAIRRGKAIGCTSVQVFTNNPRQWTDKPIPDAAISDFQAACAETGIDSVVSHDTYLVNLCAPVEETESKSITALGAELSRCARYGIPFAVSHMGAHMGAGEEAGLKKVAENALKVLDNAPETVTLLMETTAGQGSSLNYKFEHLATLLELTKGHARLAVCLDTCHIFAAGYDIRTAEGYERTFAEFDRLVGLDRLKVIHCNDSKKALATRVDRHEHLGQGEIGPTAFEMLVNDPRFFNVPILVETPEAETQHEANVQRLWSWIH